MIDFIYVDLKDGTGGFMIPDVEDNKELVNDLLKDHKYVLRKGGEDDSRNIRDSFK